MNHRLYLSLVVLFGLTGCAQQEPAEQSSADAPALRAMGQSATVEEGRTDEAIGTEIRQRLQTEGPAETASVIVQVNDRVVTLSGSVPSLPASWRAQAAAYAVKGVKRVVNQLVVTAPAPSLVP